MSVLNNHLKLVCSPVCLLLFLSCALLISPSLSLLLPSHKWLCNECCIWRRGDETLLGGGYAGVPGEISSCVYTAAHVEDILLNSLLNVSPLFTILNYHEGLWPLCVLFSLVFSEIILPAACLYFTEHPCGFLGQLALSKAPNVGLEACAPIGGDEEIYPPTILTDQIF